MERVLHVARSPADIRTAPVSVPVPISLRTERNTPLEARRIRKRDRARRRTRRDLRTHHSRRRAMVAAGDVPSAAAAPPNRSRSQCGIQQPRVPALKSNRRAHRNSRALRARDTRRTAVHRRASSVKNCEAHWRAHWTGAHWTGKPRSQFCRGAVPVLNWCPSTGAHWTERIGQASQDHDSVGDMCLSSIGEGGAPFRVLLTLRRGGSVRASWLLKS